MPYEWITPEDPAPRNAPTAELHIWPYRSLPRRDFVTFISSCAALALLPLTALLGTPALWGVLPFLILAIAAVWYALQRSHKDGEVIEELRIWPDRITLEHRSRRGHHMWEANPYWVQTKMDPHHDRIPNYITLKGNDREVELGAFLSEDERAALFDEVDRAIRQALPNL